MDNGTVSASYRERKKADHTLHDETQREELQCQVENDTAEGSVVKTVRVLLVPSLGEGDDHLTAGLCHRVIGRGNSEAHRRMEARRGHEHLEFRLGCACMERATEDRELPILVERFLKDRWLVARNKKCEDTQHRWIVGRLLNEVITSGVQTLVLKSDQEASIVDVKSSLMGEMRGVEGSTIVSEESHD